MRRCGQILAICTGLSALSCGQAEGGGETDRLQRGHEQTVHDVLQSREEALRQDIELVAQAKGLSYEQALARYEATEAVGRLAEQVASRFPERFVGSVITDVPGQPPQLLITGKVDAAIAELIANLGHVVEVMDDQPYSFEELQDRLHTVHTELIARGYPTVGGAFDIRRRGAMTFTLQRSAGLPRTATELRHAMPGRLARKTAIEGVIPKLVRSQHASARPIETSELAFEFQDAPVAVAHNSIGGMRTYDGTQSECTSGWTVRPSIPQLGTTGIVSAGHCSGVDRIVHADGADHSMTIQQSHMGIYGDFEWYTTSSTEPAEFYVGVGEKRDTLFAETLGGLTIGESVCLYSRKQNERFCNLEIELKGRTFSSHGIIISNLVQMNGGVSVPGDSGAGWFFGNRAFGVSHGQTPGCLEAGCIPTVEPHDLWSVASLVEAAFSQSVLEISTK